MQVRIYVGAISVFVLFAIMMTRDVAEGNPSNRLRIPAGIAAALFGAVAISVAVSTNWNTIEAAIAANTISLETGERIGEVFSNTVPWIARLLLRDFVLAFEISSVVLLAAIIGALALVRER